MAWIAAANLVSTGSLDTIKEQNREFVTKIAELAYMPDEMEEFLPTRIKAHLETAEGITDAITQIEWLMSGPGAFRRFIQEAIADVLPKAPRGGLTEFDPARDPDRFLNLSEQMSDICNQILGLREQFPRKSINELIMFLYSENPEGTEFLRKHRGYITRTMNDFDFRILKTQNSRVRRLSDAVAGKELFGWAFTYAVHRGGEFRRAKGIVPEK